jgi:hypothetical protein
MILDTTEVSVTVLMLVHFSIHRRETLDHQPAGQPHPAGATYIGVVCHVLHVETVPVFTVPVFTVPVFTVPVFTVPVFTVPVFTVPVFTVPVFTVLIHTLPLRMFHELHTSHKG